MRKSCFLLVITVLVMPTFKYAHSNKFFSSNPYPLSILITEVLFDPDPVINLPDCEYIELYNRGEDTVDLLGWSLRVGDKIVSLQSFQLAPGHYVVLSSLAGAQEFNDRELPVLPLYKWPTLRNSGQFLALLSPEGAIIHYMTYHPLQYIDDLKREGGWSLELSDLDYPCRKQSWLPSIDVAGGTPGRESSVYNSVLDNSPPKPIRVGVKDDKTLVLNLNKSILPISTPEWLSFLIEPPLLMVESWKYQNHRPWMIEIELSDTISITTRFSLSVEGQATDCAGENMLPGRVNFGIPARPDSGKVVITEILFDPDDQQAEFIGLQNLSNNILPLNRLYIALCDEDGVIMRFSKPLEESFLMFPGEEYVLTADQYKLTHNNDKIPVGRICERTDLPLLSNQGSILCVLDEHQSLLDQVRYEPDWHDSRLEETKGISLERIRLDQSGMVSSNWHSASIVSGGSTPGEVNSQHSDGSNETSVFSLENSAFCPNQDGFADYLLIKVSCGEPGWMGSAGVWNLSGQQVKVLFEPGSLPMEGIIKWDGSNELGNRVPAGYYIVIINYVQADGSKGRWKEACAVIAW